MRKPCAIRLADVRRRRARTAFLLGLYAVMQTYLLTSLFTLILWR